MELITSLGINIPIAIVVAVIAGWLWKNSKHTSNRWLIAWVFAVSVAVNGIWHAAEGTALVEANTVMECMGKVAMEGLLTTAGAVLVHQTGKTTFLGKVTNQAKAGTKEEGVSNGNAIDHGTN